MPLSHMESVVGSSPGNIFHILLAHNPNYLKTYADWGSDLVLAGHFHGGMVRIPKFGGVISPQFQIFPKYDAGEFHVNQNNKNSNHRKQDKSGKNSGSYRDWNR